MGFLWKCYLAANPGKKKQKRQTRGECGKVGKLGKWFKNRGSSK